MARQASSIFTRDLALAAVKDAFPKLDPRLQVRNPVMFIVELGSVITTGIFVLDLARGDTDDLWFVGVITVWLWLTVLFANFAEAIAEGRRQGAGGRTSCDTYHDVRLSPRGFRRARGDRGGRSAARGRRRRRGGPGHSRRRRDHRRRRLGRRVGDHRRVRPRDPGSRRRPLGRHRRDPAALGPARDRGDAGARPVVPRPHDRPRRGRGAAQDPERDRAQHPARRADDHLSRSRRDAEPFAIYAGTDSRRPS